MNYAKKAFHNVAALSKFSSYLYNSEKTNLTQLLNRNSVILI